MINEKYSGKAFPYHGVSFKDRPAGEFNNSEIERSCFYQEWVHDGDVLKDIFPVGMAGVTFRNCNLDNVYVDEVLNTIVDCSHRRIRVQNDWDDWILEAGDKPVEPINKEERLRHGISISAKDIPIVKFTFEERSQFENSLFEEVI